MVRIEGHGRPGVAEPNFHIEECLGLIGQPHTRGIAELLQPDSFVLVIVDHDLVPAVGTALEMTGMGGVDPQQRVECLCHRAHIHRTTQSQGKTDEVLGFRVELLAWRQIADLR
jgi:hypothetical protein